MFAGVYVLRALVKDADQAICVLYVLPIALVGFAFGRRAGLLAGVGGVGLFALSAEINDSVVQGLAAAKWTLEGGGHDRGIDLLTATMQVAEALVADLLADRPLRRSPHSLM